MFRQLLRQKLRPRDPIDAALPQQIESGKLESHSLRQRLIPGSGLNKWREIPQDMLNEANEIRSTETEFRSAMAGYDRKAMAMAQARQRQARAQLDLINQQISRASVTAPAAGIVVSGDLTQALGAPVERGEELLARYFHPPEAAELRRRHHVSVLALSRGGEIRANPSAESATRRKKDGPTAAPSTAAASSSASRSA